MFDVVVVGGSVAGSVTARALALRGRSVVVLDRAAFPRDKPCGEGILPHGVEALRAIGLYDRVASLGRPFHGIGYHVDGISAEGRFPRGQGLGVRRLALDAALQDAARAAGVDVRLGVTAGVPVRDPNGVTVPTDAGDVRARLLIGADGLHSGVRRALGLHVRERGDPRFGARWHVALAAGIPVRDVVDVYLCDGFEVYVTPVGGQVVNLALLCGRDVSRGFGGDLGGALARRVREVPAIARFLDGAEDVSAAAMAGPLRQTASGLVAERALLVGDAAGFVDAITGEGMSLALLGAVGAAEVADRALSAGDLSADALRPYEMEHRRRSRDLQRFTDLVLWWSRRRWLARGVVRAFARRPAWFGRVLGLASA